MAKGENIFKRKDGRWEARYIKGRELSGKIKYGFCYGKTYREAKEKAAEYKTAVANGQVIAANAGKYRFAFFCDEWLRSKKDAVKESTYIKYNTVIEKHIKPKLGGCFPLGINMGLIDEFTHQLLFGEKMAAKTVHDILTILRSVLNYALERFPRAFANVKINFPKEEKKEMRVLSRDEQQRFLKYLLTDTDCCKFGVILALLTGIRIGELCALRWCDIDIFEETVKISSTLQRLQNMNPNEKARTHIVVDSPKSARSARTIPLTGYAAELCRKMQPENPNYYILTGTADYMEPRTLQYRIKKYALECGLDGVHAHTLRHTFATRAIEVGFEIKSLSEILGHSTTTITLERYVHSSLKLKRLNMDKLTAAGF